MHRPPARYRTVARTTVQPADACRCRRCRSPARHRVPADHRCPPLARCAWTATESGCARPAWPGSQRWRGCPRLPENLRCARCHRPARPASPPGARPTCHREWPARHAAPSPCERSRIARSSYRSVQRPAPRCACNWRAIRSACRCCSCRRGRAPSAAAASARTGGQAKRTYSACLKATGGAIRCGGRREAAVAAAAAYLLLVNVWPVQGKQDLVRRTR